MQIMTMHDVCTIKDEEKLLLAPNLRLLKWFFAQNFLNIMRTKVGCGPNLLNSMCLSRGQKP